MAKIDRFTKYDDLPELLRVEEYAAFLGIGRGLAYAMVHKGTVESIKLGRLVRVRRSSLNGNHEAEK